MTALEERRIKSLLKDAVVEVLEERQDLLRNALRESLEDMQCSRQYAKAKSRGARVGRKSINGSRAPREHSLSRVL
ncbi:MAG: hypothetical protein ACR2OZ_19435 [Verrucomicrobiales bacterium]